MSHQRSGVVLLFVVLSLGLSSPAMAVMESSEKDASVRKLGVAWNIAEDRKMENIAGIAEPEGLDKYMKRYFDQFSVKMSELSTKVDRLSAQVAQLDVKINALAVKKDAEKTTALAKMV